MVKPYIKVLGYDEEVDERLNGKKICVEFVETVDSEELYVKKSINENKSNTEMVLESERNILKTVLPYSYEGIGETIIFIDESINGEKLFATDEEKLEYINSINADFYIRIELYEGDVNTWDESQLNKEKENEWAGRVGYYRNADINIVKAFISNEEDEKDAMVKLTNEYFANNCEIPIVVQFIGFIEKKEGKNVIKFFDFNGSYNSYERGIVTMANTLKTSEAQKLIKANKEKNETKRNTVLKKLKNVQYLDDENKVQQEILAQKEQQNQPIENNQNINNIVLNNQVQIENTPNEKNEVWQESTPVQEQNESQLKNIIVFAAIGFAIIICIGILILEFKGNKKGGV